MRSTRFSYQVARRGVSGAVCVGEVYISVDAGHVSRVDVDSAVKGDWRVVSELKEEQTQKGYCWRGYFGGCGVGVSPVSRRSVG